LSSKSLQGPKAPDAATALRLPVITISRSFGAHGIQVAQRVATALGFGLWGRELVSATAQQVGTSLASVRGLDERVRTSVDDWIDSMFYDAVPQRQFAELLFEVIRSVARMGSAVVVGRGGHYLVDPGDSLRVRISAPFEVRASRYAEKHELSIREAEKIVRVSDGERENFLRHHFGQDFADIHNFDICLNASLFSVHQASSLIVSAYDAKFRSLIDLERVQEALDALEQSKAPETCSSIPPPPIQCDGETLIPADSGDGVRTEAKWSHYGVSNGDP
jgi:cytidylate kinase